MKDGEEKLVRILSIFTQQARLEGSSLTGVHSGYSLGTDHSVLKGRLGCRYWSN